MVTRAHGWVSWGTQRLSSGQFILRGERPNGSMATTVVEDDDIFQLLQAKILAKKQAKRKELDEALQRCYPSI